MCITILLKTLHLICLIREIRAKKSYQTNRIMSKLRYIYNYYVTRNKPILKDYLIQETLIHLLFIHLTINLIVSLNHTQKEPINNFKSQIKEHKCIGFLLMEKAPRSSRVKNGESLCSKLYLNPLILRVSYLPLSFSLQRRLHY